MAGQLPWRLPTFLRDAYDHGVLRQVGPLYQFRHDRLRHYLAGPPPERPVSTPARPRNSWHRVDQTLAVLGVTGLSATSAILAWITTFS